MKQSTKRRMPDKIAMLEGKLLKEELAVCRTKMRLAIMKEEDEKIIDAAVEAYSYAYAAVFGSRPTLPRTHE